MSELTLRYAVRRHVAGGPRPLRRGCGSPLAPVEPTRLPGRGRPFQAPFDGPAHLREPVTVAGRLLDFSTGAGIPNATLTYRPSAISAAALETSVVTAADGSYTVSLPVLGFYLVLLDGAWLTGAGVHAFSYRGDLLANTGHCVVLYGTVIDLHALRPIAGVVVSAFGRQATTESDGWYRLDIECPADRPPGCGSGPRSTMSTYHPDYGTRIFFTTRCGAARSDLLLERKR